MMVKVIQIQKYDKITIGYSISTNTDKFNSLIPADCRYVSDRDSWN